MLFACGMCADTMLHQSNWLFAVVPFALLVLIVDAPLSARGGWVRSLVVVGLVSVVAAIAVAAEAPSLGMAVLFGGLLARSLVVGALSARQRPRFALMRVGGVVAALGLGVVVNLPRFRDSEGLVRLLTATPYRFDGSSWALAELRSRPEALGLINAALADALSRDVMARRRVVLLELHAAVGGPAAERAAGCKVTAPKADEEERVVATWARVCGG